MCTHQRCQRVPEPCVLLQSCSLLDLMLRWLSCDQLVALALLPWPSPAHIQALMPVN